MGRGMIKGKLGEVKLITRERYWGGSVGDVCKGRRTSFLFGERWGLRVVEMIERELCAGGQMAMRKTCGGEKGIWEKREA